MSEKLHRHCDNCRKDFDHDLHEISWFGFSGDAFTEGAFTPAVILKSYGREKRVTLPLDFCSVKCIVDWLSRHGVKE